MREYTCYYCKRTVPAESGSMPDKVWVVISGMYSDQCVDAIFSTAEKAMATYPEETWEYRVDKFWGEEWTNTEDFGDFIAIRPFILNKVQDA